MAPENRVPGVGDIVRRAHSAAGYRLAPGLFALRIIDDGRIVGCDFAQIAPGGHPDLDASLVKRRERCGEQVGGRSVAGRIVLEAPRLGPVPDDVESKVMNALGKGVVRAVSLVDALRLCFNGSVLRLLVAAVPAVLLVSQLPMADESPSSAPVCLHT